MKLWLKFQPFTIHRLAAIHTQTDLQKTNSYFECTTGNYFQSKTIKGNFSINKNVFSFLIFNKY